MISSNKVGLVCAAVIIFLVWFAVKGPQVTMKTAPGFSLEMTDLHLIGRQGGERLWEIRAGGITTSIDGTVKTLTDIHEGFLYHDDKRQTGFSAPQAVYDAKTGSISFPLGVSMSTTSGCSLLLEKASWEAASRSLLTEGPAILRWNGNEVKALGLTAEKGSASIKAKDIILVNDQGIKAAGKSLIYDDASMEVLLPEMTVVEYQGYKFTVNKAVYDMKRHYLRLNEVVGTGQQGEVVTAVAVSIDQDKETMEAEGGTISLQPGEFGPKQVAQERVTITADTLRAGSAEQQSWAMAGNVKIVRPNGDALQATRSTLSMKDKNILMTGGVTFRQSSGDYELFANQLSYWWESEELNAEGEPSMKHQNGAVVSGKRVKVDFANRTVQMTEAVKMVDSGGTIVTGEEQFYDERLEQATIKGAVKVSYPDGRWLTAERMVYNTATGNADFLGNIQAGLTKRKSEGTQ